ncbi:MAG TPA: hypothetical protein DEH22_04960 [Chloroflexi bacterium]|nr:hypothetical protein [Chloroflexota bacterium]
MKKKFVYAGFVLWLFAVILDVINLTWFEATAGDTNLVNISVYPAAFLALLGLLLVFLGLKPLLRSP